MTIDMLANKQTILGLLDEVPRDGIGNLKTYLSEESDFFTAPCSKDHHLNVEGGLAQHSLNVFYMLTHIVDNLAKTPTLMETLIVCGIGHDLCKTNFYKKGGKPSSESQFNYFKSLRAKVPLGGPRHHMMEQAGLFEPEFRPSSEYAGLLIDWLNKRDSSAIPAEPLAWSYEDKLPLGHGEKSVYLLSKFIALTDEEVLAIRWHMGSFDSATKEGFTKYAYEEAMKNFPLTALLHIADMLASYALEREVTE